MSAFLSSKLAELEPYVPGEQPRDRKYIKLNTNESPFPPSAGVMRAINTAEVASLNLYSDPTAKPLVGEIAARFGITPEEVFVGNGSDEVLAFIFDAFCDKEKGIAYPDITYGFYSVFAKLFCLKSVTVPLDAGYGINVSDYTEISDNVIIANPNAQTGLYLTPEKTEELVAQRSDRLVIIDEAYIDFGGESAYPLIRKYKNLIIVQTFSKSRNLAGARVGFAIACPELIADLNTMKYSFNPYNINRLSMLAATAAMADYDYMKLCTTRITKTREETKEKLIGMGFEVLDSKANFLLAAAAAADGAELYAALKERGILVRHLGDERIARFIRITIGTTEQMKALTDALSDILKKRTKL